MRNVEIRAVCALALCGCFYHENRWNFYSLGFARSCLQLFLRFLCGHAVCVFACIAKQLLVLQITTIRFFSCVLGSLALTLGHCLGKETDQCLERLSDRLAIKNLLTLYATSVDTQNWGVYKSVFSEDALIDYTAAGGQKGTPKEAFNFDDLFKSGSDPA